MQLKIQTTAQENVHTEHTFNEFKICKRSYLTAIITNE